MEMPFCPATCFFGAENELKTCNYVPPVLFYACISIPYFILFAMYSLKHVTSFDWLLSFQASVRPLVCLQVS